jgi:FG-GAP-like repeat/FG-GAP repeat
LIAAASVIGCMFASACGLLAADHTSSNNDDGGNDSSAPDTAVSPIVDGGEGDPPPSILLRQIAPVSTSHVTNRRPTLHWKLPSNGGSVTLELCSDRPCTKMIGAPITITGTSYTPTSDLPIGVVFWRLHSSHSNVPATATWELTVGAGNAPVDAAWGTTFDVNGDGLPDRVFAGRAENRAYIFLGTRGEPSMTPDVILETTTYPRTADYYGSVGSAGDINGDGFADLVVGATEATAKFPGEVRVYLGNAVGLTQEPSSFLTGYGSTFGADVGTAGDVNGDGYADLMVTAAGEGIYVFLGSASGIASTPSIHIGSTGLATSGDFNGDGYGDIAAGAQAAGGQSVVNVYLGGLAGISTAPSSVLSAPNGATTSFGYTIACAGDVNDDGYADLISADIEIPATDPHAYVFLGGPTGLTPTPASKLIGPSDPDAEFGSAVASAGDVNGDGYDDVVVGAPVAAEGDGAAFVYLGNASGVGTSSSTTIVSPANRSYFGLSLGSAGDINGDGYDDVMIGAETAYEVGAVFFFLGSATGASDTSAFHTTGDISGELYGMSIFGATN